MVLANTVRLMKRSLKMAEAAGRRKSNASLMKRETKMEAAPLALSERLSARMAPDVKENAEIIHIEPQMASASLISAASTLGFSSVVAVITAQQARKPHTMEGHASLISSAQTTRETTAVVSVSRTPVVRPVDWIFKADASYAMLATKLLQMERVVFQQHQPAQSTPDSKLLEPAPTGAELTHATTDKSLCSTVLANTVDSTQESRLMAGAAPRTCACSQDRSTLRMVPVSLAHNTPSLVQTTTCASSRISTSRTRVRDQSELATTMVFSAFLVTQSP